MNKYLLIGLLVLLLATGCGTTNIYTSNANAELYVNGRYKGKGYARLVRTGPPLSIKVTAKVNGVVVGSVTERRQFTFGTFCLGFCTYGIGFVSAWRFPETIYIPLMISADTSNDASGNHGSVWDLPPGEYHKKSGSGW